MSDPQPCSEAELQCLRECLERVVGDLALISDHEMTIGSLETLRSGRRIVGKGSAHVSFKLGFESSTGQCHGCLLVPLPGAITVACFMMLVPTETVRAQAELDSVELVGRCPGDQ